MADFVNCFAAIFEREARLVRALICAAFCQLFLGAAHAQIYTMNSGNSSASVNYTVGNQQGFDDWTVDGVNQMGQQSFWFEIGGSGPAANIGSSPVSVSTTTTANTLDVNYTYSQFTFNELFSLTGSLPGTGISDMAETITVNNTSGSSLGLYLYQYTDLNLLNNPNGNSVALYQSGRNSLFNEAYQTQGNLASADVVNTPGANLGEAAPTATILNLLNGPGFPVLNDNLAVGPTDAAYALQWDFSLAATGANSSVIISEDMNLQVVPEPSSWTLALAGLTTLVVFRRQCGRTA